MSTVKNSTVKMRLNTVIEPGSVVLGRVIFIIIYSKKVELGFSQKQSIQSRRQGFRFVVQLVDNLVYRRQVQVE